ncbi:hypothetical protein [Lewinella sp. IMCC34183]|uniref:hypothetical protein n=1 Tax=Lewinella sp. IMCC34183 TaxID=2248762 RepID=UPI00130040FE|nr:hypothetical protein [Lewinella sp. IMCC34183]
MHQLVRYPYAIPQAILSLLLLIGTPAPLAAQSPPDSLTLTATVLDSTNLLSWTAAGDTLTDHYRLEWSTSEAAAWSPLSQAPAGSDPREEITYRVRDRRPAPHACYRLIRVARGGAEYPVASTTVIRRESASPLTATYAPEAGAVRVTFRVDTGGTVRLHVYGSDQEVRVSRTVLARRGTSQATLTLPEPVAGAYTVVLELPDGTLHRAPLAIHAR